TALPSSPSLSLPSLPCSFLFCSSRCLLSLFFFFCNDPAPTELYTLSLHDALPISDEICAAPDSASVAVCDEPETFVMTKTDVNVLADGTVPNARESVSTLPLATGVDVPA